MKCGGFDVSVWLGLTTFPFLRFLVQVDHREIRVKEEVEEQQAFGSTDQRQQKHTQALSSWLGLVLALHTLHPPFLLDCLSFRLPMLT